MLSSFQCPILLLKQLRIIQTKLLAINYFRKKAQSQALLKKCPYLEFFWSLFSCILTEYGEILRVSPHSIRMWENTDQKNSEYGHFLSSECLIGSQFNSFMHDFAIKQKIQTSNFRPHDVVSTFRQFAFFSCEIS